MVLGDSISANYTGLYVLPSSAIYAVSEARTRAGILSLAVPGYTIDNEQSVWDSSFIKGRSSVKCVIMQVGANNILINNESSSTIITKYNALIADVNAANPTAKIILGQLTPFRAAMTGAQYTVWQAVNAAISGGTITGSNIIARPVWTVLNDGSDNLVSTYNSGDNVHPISTGRQQMGALWRTELQSAGLL